MTRRACPSFGFTILELLIGSALSVLVLTALYLTWSGGIRMGKATQAGQAASGAAILQLMYAEDLAQFVPIPDCPSTDLLQATSSAIAFYRARFQKDDAVQLEIVKYDLVPTPGGNRALRRTEGLEAHVVKGVLLSDLQYDLLQADQGPILLKVSALLLDVDDPPGADGGTPVRKFPWSVVLPLGVPGQFCNPAFASSLKFEVPGPLPDL